MANLGQMVTRILDELNRTDLTSQAGAAIRTAIEHYSGRPLGFNETATATTTTAGIYQYALPADFRADRMVCIDDDGHRARLTKQPYEEFMARWDDNYSGTPSKFTIYGDNVLLWPVPDATYSYILSYTLALPELSDTGSNVWTNRYEEVIRMRSQADLLENVIRGEEALVQAGICRQREADSYAMRTENRATVDTTRIRRRGML